MLRLYIYVLRVPNLVLHGQFFNENIPKSTSVLKMIRMRDFTDGTSTRVNVLENLKSNCICL